MAIPDELRVIIDGVDIPCISSFKFSYEWISDSGRNRNDYMIIQNPVKKRKITISADELTQDQYATVFGVVGKTNLCHTVTLFDDETKTLKTFDMYNSALSGEKRVKGNQVKYLGISFSLIER